MLDIELRALHMLSKHFTTWATSAFCINTEFKISIKWSSKTLEIAGCLRIGQKQGDPCKMPGKRTEESSKAEAKKNLNYSWTSGNPVAFVRWRLGGHGIPSNMIGTCKSLVAGDGVRAVEKRLCKGRRQSRRPWLGGAGLEWRIWSVCQSAFSRVREVTEWISVFGRGCIRVAYRL